MGTPTSVESFQVRLVDLFHSSLNAATNDKTLGGTEITAQEAHDAIGLLIGEWSERDMGDIANTLQEAQKNRALQPEALQRLIAAEGQARLLFWSQASHGRPPGMAVTGSLTTGDKKAIMAFQEAHGLPASGNLLDGSTMNLLRQGPPHPRDPSVLLAKPPR